MQTAVLTRRGGDSWEETAQHREHSPADTSAHPQLLIPGDEDLDSEPGVGSVPQCRAVMGADSESFPTAPRMG